MSDHATPGNRFLLPMAVVIVLGGVIAVMAGYRGNSHLTAQSTPVATCVNNVLTCASGSLPFCQLANAPNARCLNGQAVCTVTATSPDSAGAPTCVPALAECSQGQAVCPSGMAVLCAGGSTFQCTGSGPTCTNGSQAYRGYCSPVQSPAPASAAGGSAGSSGQRAWCCFRQGYACVAVSDERACDTVPGMPPLFVTTGVDGSDRCNVLCNPGAAVSPPTGPASCGNSRLEGVEQCDDGNLTAGDGCSAACQVEDGFTCTPSNVSPPTPPTPPGTPPTPRSSARSAASVQGASSTGAASQPTVSAPCYQCDRSTFRCEPRTTEQCAANQSNPSYGTSLDACSGHCGGTGWFVTDCIETDNGSEPTIYGSAQAPAAQGGGFMSRADTCVVEGGQVLNEFACIRQGPGAFRPWLLSSYRVECAPGLECRNGACRPPAMGQNSAPQPIAAAPALPSTLTRGLVAQLIGGGTPSVCTPTCGDGKLKGNEQCDDGNGTRFDGCYNCQIETPRCGNGVVEAGEECEQSRREEFELPTCTTANDISCPAGFSLACRNSLAINGAMWCRSQLQCIDGEPTCLDPLYQPNLSPCALVCYADAMACEEAGESCNDSCACAVPTAQSTSSQSSVSSSPEMCTATQSYFEYQLTTAGTVKVSGPTSVTLTPSSCESTSPGTGWTRVDQECLFTKNGVCNVQSCLWRKPSTTSFEYRLTHTGGGATGDTASYDCSKSPPAGYTVKMRACLGTRSDQSCFTDICLLEKVGTQDMGREFLLTHGGAHPQYCNANPAAPDMNYNSTAVVLQYNNSSFPWSSPDGSLCLWERVHVCTADISGDPAASPPGYVACCYGDTAKVVVAPAPNHIMPESRYGTAAGFAYDLKGNLDNVRECTSMPNWLTAEWQGLPDDASLKRFTRHCSEYHNRLYPPNQAPERPASFPVTCCKPSVGCGQTEAGNCAFPFAPDQTGQQACTAVYRASNGTCSL